MTTAIARVCRLREELPAPFANERSFQFSFIPAASCVTLWRIICR